MKTTALRTTSYYAIIFLIFHSCTSSINASSENNVTDVIPPIICSSDGDYNENDRDVRLLRSAFNRFSGSDGTMDHEEWNIFARHLNLLSCDDDGTTRPGVKLMVKDGVGNVASCDGEYSPIFGERWNGHEVYVNTLNDRILMFRYGRWLITRYENWPSIRRIGANGKGTGFQRSVRYDSVIEGSSWANFDVIPIHIQAVCEDYIEKNRTDAIWDDVNEPLLSYDHFLTALEIVAFNRKEHDQSRNTVDEIYHWIEENHANEEHAFCYNNIIFFVAAIVIVCGISIGLGIMALVKRRSRITVPIAFTTVKTLD